MLDLLRHAPDNGDALPADEGNGLADVRRLAIDQLKLEQELEQAVAGEQLQVHYQPIVATGDGHTAGFEALVRWLHPERGMVAPLDFIGLAEDTGLIVPIGLRVLEASCRGLKALQQRLAASFGDAPPAFMGVNLSARQIGEPGLVAAVAEVIESSGVEASCLKLEVTESVLMEDPEQSVAVLGELKALGVELAVDDFGTGYSSLSYLNRFPIDVVKVDRSFVNTMLSDSGNLKIVRGITSLAKELGMRLVAEGVERHEELVLIRDLGCDYAQGYLFSKPLPLAETVDLVGKRLG
jgi:EAL domain-containing protein (putative c-di-GMP-specific phosphodiesterase class I)